MSLKFDIREYAAARSISAWVILDPKGRYVATVRAFYGNAVTVNVWQSDDATKRSLAAATKAGASIPVAGRYMAPFDYQAARAGGGGYDRLTSALSGMWIDGHEMTDHCGRSLKPPRGLKYFPADFKAPKGYQTANYAQYDAASGESRPTYYWREMAEKELGEGAAWEAVKARADEMQMQADTVGGYSSCYRESGFDYLRALGYQLIRAV